MLCPRCRKALAEEQTGSVLLRACGHCGGLWLDNEASRRVVASFEAGALAIADRVAEQGTEDAAGGRNELPCPECGVKLVATFVSDAGVEIDICDRHGTWFDRCELQRVAEAMLTRDSIPDEGNPFAMEDPELRRDAAKWNDGQLTGFLDVNRDGQVDAKDLVAAVVGIGRGLLKARTY